MNTVGKQWIKAEFFPTNARPFVHWYYCRDEGDANAMAAAEGFGYRYELNPVGEHEVPVVLAGVTMATTEQLRNALIERGWKVHLR